MPTATMPVMLMLAAIVVVLVAVAMMRTRVLSRKHLDNAVATRADDVPPVLAPHDAAHALAAHRPVRHDVLRADALVQRPESDRGVVACGHGFPAVVGEG